MSYQIQLIYQNNVRITGINNILKLSIHWYVIQCREANENQQFLWISGKKKTGGVILSPVSTAADNLLIKIIDNWLTSELFPLLGKCGGGGGGLKQCKTVTCSPYWWRGGEGLMRRYRHRQVTHTTALHCTARNKIDFQTNQQINIII